MAPFSETSFLTPGPASRRAVLRHDCKLQELGQRTSLSVVFSVSLYARTHKREIITNADVCSRFARPWPVFLSDDAAVHHSNCGWHAQRTTWRTEARSLLDGKEDCSLPSVNEISIWYNLPTMVTPSVRRYNSCRR